MIMKYTKHVFLITISLLLNLSYSFADSPLTSTEFFQSYLDIPMVKQALDKKGKLSNDLIEFIASNDTPLEVKLAVINAIGWKISGTQNAKAYMQFIVKQKNYKSGFGSAYMNFKNMANSEELICYAYLSSLDNYFEVSDAYRIAKISLKKAPYSYAINMITALIKAQVLTSIDENCQAANIFSAIKTNPEIIIDMRIEAQALMHEYIDDISAHCDLN